MNRILLFLFLMGSITCSLAQRGNRAGMFGQVVSKADQQGLAGAKMTLIGEQLPQPKGTLTDSLGRFRIFGMPSGTYTLTIDLLGYAPFEQEITLQPGPNRIGILSLEPKTVELDQVDIEGKAPMAQQEGDTTIFNANSFKTNPDANAQDLVEKLPGVVNSDGKIQAQGEDVRQVLVDGKPFFGNDPNAALKNLPAEVIDKIQVFDQQSDQSRFTGFDDGNTTKTINIVTKPGMNQGQFGRIYGGYGNDGDFEEGSHRYNAGGNINIFNGDSRLALIAQSNNINVQNFSTEDLLGVVGSNGGGRGGSGGRPGGGRRRRGGPPGSGGVQGANVSDFLVGTQGGISTTHAGGLNYTDKWGKKVEVAGSYFFNQSDNLNETSLRQQYVTTADSGQIYQEASTTNSINTNHRFNAEIEYKIDERNSLLLRPRLSLQLNSGTEITDGQLTFGDGLLSGLNSDFQSDLTGLSFNSTILWRHKFKKMRRTLSVNVTPTISQNEGESFLLSNQNVTNGNTVTDSLDQQSLLDSDTRGITARVQFTEPIGMRAGFTLNYQSGYTYSQSDKQTFNFQAATEGYTALDSSLSNITASRYLTQEGGVGFRYFSRELILGGNVGLQWSRLQTEQEIPVAPAFSQTFVNLVPRVFMRYKIDQQKTLRAFYRANTDAPSITQLQDVIDNSNPLQLSTGNPELDQAWQHSLFIRYNQTNTDKSSVFFFLLGGSYTYNYIGQQTLFITQDSVSSGGFSLQPGDQLSRPVNLDGYYNVRSYFTYGFPISPLKTNFNADLTMNFARQPGLLGDELNFANNLTTAVGLTFSSNISENVDFTLSSRTSYNLVANTLQPSLDQTYWNQNTRLRLNLIFGDGFVFRSSVSHQFYDGLSEGFDQNYVLWSGAIAKKFLKDNRGELALSVYDALMQNTSVGRNVSEVYIEDTQSLVLQRYVMLTFSYNIRHFRGKSSKP